MHSRKAYPASSNTVCIMQLLLLLGQAEGCGLLHSGVLASTVVLVTPATVMV
jgi:hypothetical protein